MILCSSWSICLLKQSSSAPSCICLDNQSTIYSSKTEGMPSLKAYAISAQWQKHLRKLFLVAYCVSGMLFLHSQEYYNNLYYWILKQCVGDIYHISSFIQHRDLLDWYHPMLLAPSLIMNQIGNKRNLIFSTVFLM